MVAIKKQKPPKDTHDLQSDVASFASSLGFFSSDVTSSGFNDSDFRKTGPIKPQKNSITNKSNEKNEKPNPRITKAKPAEIQKHGPMNSNLLAEKENTKFKNLPKLPLVKASELGVWYKYASDLEDKLIGNDKKIEANNIEEWKVLVEKKKELGERLLAQYSQDYVSSRGKNGDIKMLYTTLRSGTAADKVSALSVLIGDNAVANSRSLDSLLGMVTSKIGKRHAFTAFEALKEILIILLPDRKLKNLSQRPLNHLADTKDGYSLLLFWYWEDLLKERYGHFVSALQEASLDVIVQLKSIALKIIYTLLRSKPEQERRLLSALVNKLGDPENKVASNADYHLANLLAEHPNMKVVVIEEVENFLFRPHLGIRAKYHAVNFLNQIRLSHKGDGPKAAKRLIDIYFDIFKGLTSESGPSQSVGKLNKNVSTFSKDSRSNASSESHVALDSRLLSALLSGVNRAFPFVPSDEADDVVQVQTPLLFRLVHSKNFNVGVQALMLLDKIASKNQIVSDRFYRALYSKLLLPAAMNSSKEEMFIALLLRTMKNDINMKRVAAFAKRLLQVALQLPPQHACACLFLLSEVLKARSPLWNMVLQNEAADEDDGLEHFVDIHENDENVADSDRKSPVDNANGCHGDSELNTTSDDKIHNCHESLVLPGGYNPKHRDPSYCNADRVGWCELTVLASHVHPSVAAMAGTLLSGVNIVYNGNPLHDLSLAAFLDKLMEKKPKHNTWHGASQIEPAKKLDMSHHLIGPDILSLAEAEVPPEDVVFHKFYANKINSSRKIKKKKKKTADDEATDEFLAIDGNDDDEDDDDEIDNILFPNQTSPERGGDYDYDDLDQIVDDDDDNLIGGDDEMDDVDDDGIGPDGDDDDDDDDVAFGEDDGEIGFEEKGRKRKSKGGSGASPFASLEDCLHLIEEEEVHEPKKKTRKDMGEDKEGRKSKMEDRKSKKKKVGEDKEGRKSKMEDHKSKKKKIGEDNERRKSKMEDPKSKKKNRNMLGG